MRCNSTQRVRASVAKNQSDVRKKAPAALQIDTRTIPRGAINRDRGIPRGLSPVYAIDTARYFPRKSLRNFIRR